MALDGNGMVPVGFRSSRLSKVQMGELLDFICEYAARHGVVFQDYHEGDGRSSLTSAPGVL
jgi:hypothetical protein